MSLPVFVTVHTRFEENHHDQPWRNELARQMNRLLLFAKAAVELGTLIGGGSNDLRREREFAEAVVAICQRVAVFEEIQIVSG